MDELHGVVRDLIVRGTYRAGEPITEQELCVRLDVSRTPVREVLRRLESDGLVHAARRGVTVVQLDAATLLETYQVRGSLEALTAELAARRQRDGELPPAALTRLSEYADAADRSTREGDLVAGTLHNRTFHQLIADLSGNRTAAESLDRIWDRIVVSTRASLVAPSRPAEVDREHRLVISAITDGRPDRAATHARDHVTATASALHPPEEGHPR